MSKTYHFIGIKGSGMSALALMLHQMGHTVQGSDVSKYYFTQRGLEQAGIKILPFSEDNITEDVELIAGNAFREDNHVEIAYAMNSWVNLCVNLPVLVWQVPTERPQPQGYYHMFSKISQIPLI